MVKQEQTLLSTFIRDPSTPHIPTWLHRGSTHHCEALKPEDGRELCFHLRCFTFGFFFPKTSPSSTSSHICSECSILFYCASFTLFFVVACASFAKKDDGKSKTEGFKVLTGSFRSAPLVVCSEFLLYGMGKFCSGLDNFGEPASRG